MTHNPTYLYLSSFCFSLFLSLVFSFEKFRAVVSPKKNIQDIHVQSASRFGGLAIIGGSLSFWLWSKTFGSDWESPLLMMLIVGISVSAVGLIDDIKGHLNIFIRLFAVSMAAIIFGLSAGWLERVDIFLLDGLLANFPLFAVVATIVSMVGLTNSMNMIDGLNGLAAGVSILAFLCMGIVNLNSATEVDVVALYVIMFSSIGFLVVNVLAGRIFLGDCGSYFLGGILAESCIYFNSQVPYVSSWFYLVLTGYPICEAIYSIIRRGKGRSWFIADRGHLHQLIHLYFSQGENLSRAKNLRSHLVSTTSVLMVVLIFNCLGMLYAENSYKLQAVFALQVLTYSFFYRLLKKKTANINEG